MNRNSRKRQILDYLLEHLDEWTHNQGLRDLTGLDDVPRTIRLLRQEGWQLEVRGDGFVRLRSKIKSTARGERKAISNRIRYQIFNESGFRCHSCGRTVREDKIKLVIDHILPVDWGGNSDISNLQALCEQCNSGKQAWVADKSQEDMKEIMHNPTIVKRIEALFDRYPNQEIPSQLIQLVSKYAFDWQRALRLVRQTTGKNIMPIRGRNTYIYKTKKN